MVVGWLSIRAIGGTGGFGRRVGAMGVAAAWVGIVGLARAVRRVLVEAGRDGGEGDEEKTKDHEDGGEPASERDLEVPVHVQMRCK